MTYQKKQEEKKGSVNPVVGAVTVAVIGAGIALAGAVVLKDKKNRNKVKKALTSVKDQAVKRVKVMRNQAQDKTKKAEKKLDDGLKDVKNATISVKRQITPRLSTVKEAN